MGVAWCTSQQKEVVVGVRVGEIIVVQFDFEGAYAVIGGFRA